MGSVRTSEWIVDAGKGRRVCLCVCLPLGLCATAGSENGGEQMKGEEMGKGVRQIGRGERRGEKREKAKRRNNRAACTGG